MRQAGSQIRQKNKERTNVNASEYGILLYTLVEDESICGSSKQIKEHPNVVLASGISGKTAARIALDIITEREVAALSSEEE